MTRHSKQKGGIGSEALTHSERQALGYGTCTERLGKDSTKDFDCCALCLQPVQDAVVTPDGVLYEREVILESLLAQKKEAARRLAIWEAQQGEEARASETAAHEAQQREVAAFHSLNSGGGGGAEKRSAEARLAPCARRRRPATHSSPQPQLAAFWVPSKTPATAAKAEKPSGDTLCPATGKRLRLKDLVPVRFTRTPDAEDGQGRFMCPLCKDAFTNVSRVVVLKPTGDAVGEECYRRFVEPEGAYDGHKVKPKDVIRLERGGTGFAATSKVEASTHTLLGIGSGLSDVRGQSAAGRSKFGGMRLG